MAKLRVYGGLIFGRGKRQVRTIVAATSKKAAAEILEMRLNDFSSIFTETGNPLELEVAKNAPNCIFQASCTMTEDFVQIDPRTRLPI